MKEEGKEDCSSLLVLNKYLLGYKTREKKSVRGDISMLCMVHKGDALGRPPDVAVVLLGASPPWILSLCSMQIRTYVLFCD